MSKNNKNNLAIKIQFLLVICLMIFQVIVWSMDDVFIAKGIKFWSILSFVFFIPFSFVLLLINEPKIKRGEKFINIVSPLLVGVLFEIAYYFIMGKETLFNSLFFYNFFVLLASIFALISFTSLIVKYKIRFQTLIIIFIAYIVYDFVGVLVLKTIATTGEAMLGISENGIRYPFPIFFIMPEFGFLGTADVVVPGIIIGQEFVRIKTHGVPIISPIALIVAHAIGIFMAYLASIYFKTGQPALVYIIPLMLLTMLVLYYYCGLLRKDYFNPVRILKEYFHCIGK